MKREKKVRRGKLKGKGRIQEGWREGRKEEEVGEGSEEVGRGEDMMWESFDLSVLHLFLSLYHLSYTSAPWRVAHWLSNPDLRWTRSSDPSFNLSR